MGTNYYRIPKSKEMTERYQKLHDRVSHLDWINPSLIERNFRDIEDPKDSWSKLNPWDEFTYDANIHLGKRSSGWKFLWNWNSKQCYNHLLPHFVHVLIGLGLAGLSIGELSLLLLLW